MPKGTVMNKRNAIHEFAVHYHDLYVNPETEEWEVEIDLAESCRALGIKMDCGKSFVEAYSMEAFNHADALNQIIDSINDVDLLGSAIFSQWRYVTHWDGYAHPFDEIYRSWFVIALGRLAELTEDSDIGRTTMSTIKIQKISITDLATDTIVNAANDGLWAGGGVCGAIFRAAGHSQLQAACDAIGHCDTGSAVITPGFRLKAKYIIHAVGPRWSGGNHKEPQLLYSAYTKSLALATENGCHSIAFPLISAGIYGYPLEGAWRKALQACRDYFQKNPDVSLNVVFAVLDDRIMAEGQRQLAEIAPELMVVHPQS